MDPNAPDPRPTVRRDPGDTSPADATGPHRSGAAVAAADAFLAPPQGPDEIGRLGPYRVLAELGRGGMGAVFRAEDPRLRRELAIKVLLPELAADRRAKARFVREAQAQAKVDHDNIIPIFEVELANGVAYIAMPLLKGQTLAAALRLNPRPPLGELVRIGREMAEGLAAAHAVGLIHRDIKPANVWLEGTKRRVKILDFGLARGAGRGDEPPVPHAPHPPAPDEDDRTDPLTARGAIVGTPAYMSPEQTRGLPLDRRSDIFSLGVLLYQMATGRRPFNGTSAFDIMAAVATEEPHRAGAIIKDLPPALDALIARMLAKAPAGRPQSCAAVVAELDAIARGLVLLPVVVPVGPVPGEPNPWEDLDSTVAQTELTDSEHLIPEKAKALSVLPKWLWPTAGALGAVALAVLVAAAVSALKPKKQEAAEEPKPKGPERSTAPNRAAGAQPAAIQEETARALGVPVQFPNGIGMKMMLIPAGTFQMGSAADDPAARPNELPRHAVTITKPFYIGAHEVTVGQFRRFVKESKYEPTKGGFYGPFLSQGGALSWDNPGYEQTDDFPVSAVSWEDAVAFCGWLSKKEGRAYRLPTEAEWEYAARAGSTAASPAADKAALFEIANGWSERPEPVGRRKPNPWGLYDVYGNVWEWIADRYDGTSGYPGGPRTDPTGPPQGDLRFIRGGGWTSQAMELYRPSYRINYTPIGPAWRHKGTGFRVVAAVAP